MNTPVKILLVDDDEEDYLITRDTIADIKGSEKYDLEWIADYNKALTVIGESKHDVYLIDYKLGPHNGLDLISKASRDSFHAPFILLTGLNNAEIDERAMQLGAADYLVKGTFSAEELNRILRYNLRDAKYLKEIRSLNTKLEKRVEERTAELAKVIAELERTNGNLQELLSEREKTQHELSKALEKEKELGLLKARFVTMASHEFRTPLSTILSSTYLLEKYKTEEEDPKRTKHIERIRANVAHLTEILNDFLSLGKLEDGKVLVEPVTFSVDELIKEAIKDIELNLKKGQTILYVHDFIPGDGHVVADKKLLKNILINLLSNAVKYSNEDQAIELEATHTMNQLKIVVCDQGIGIPEKDQAHLFDRFFRAENALNIQGTGLGLNIVKKYLELMRGEISFTSKQNEGTVFTVSLPINN